MSVLSALCLSVASPLCALLLLLCVLLPLAAGVRLL